MASNCTLMVAWGEWLTGSCGLCMTLRVGHLSLVAPCVAHPCMTHLLGYCAHSLILVVLTVFVVVLVVLLVFVLVAEELSLLHFPLVALMPSSGPAFAQPSFCL